MTDDWATTKQALDHHETAAVLAAALPDTIMDGFREYGLEGDTRKNVADDLAAELARAGYALVRTPITFPFLTRKED